MDQEDLRSDRSRELQVRGAEHPQPMDQESLRNHREGESPVPDAGGSPEPLTPHSFLFGNIGSLLSRSGRVAKLPILKNDAKENNYLFMAFTESHLDDTSKEAEYHIEGYSHIVCNRIDREKGGVILYLRKDFTYKTLTSQSDDMCSFLALTINELNLTVMLTYRPPSRYDTSNRYNGERLETSFNQIVLQNIEKVMGLLGTPSPNILVMGDFNFPNAIWREGTATPITGNASGKASETNMLNDLLAVCENHHFLQNIPFGTRPTPSGTENMLDLIFSNNHQLLSEIRKAKTALSDHALIECDIAYHFSHNRKSKIATPEDQELNLASFNLHKADWKSIRSFLKSINWYAVLENKSNEEGLQIIISIVFDALESFCPKYKSKRGQNKSHIPRDRRILFQQRKRMKNKVKKLGPNTLRAHRLQNDIVEIERRIMGSKHAERLLEEEKAVNNIKENPKFFYSFARKHQKIKSDIGPLKVNGTLLTTPEEICESLSAQYSSVYSPVDPNNSIKNPTAFFNLDSCDLETLQDIKFTEENIEEEIDTLRNNSAAGPDRFPALLLKMCKKELKKPLYILWRASLTNCDIAQIFRHAIACPVLKNNSVNYLPKSYRPVSLTSHLIKIFEKIMVKEIVKFLHKHNLLPWNQHSFLRGRSTVSQLLNQCEIVLRYLETGNCADTIYLDFAKAFDKVDHTLLCKKLKEKRIGGKVGNWLHSFLTNRTLQVSANGALSKPAPVLSGVPQGTVLGPILFLIMISDIDKNLNHTFMSLFADDSRVTRKITTDDDCHLLQKELDEVIYPWAIRNNAIFNGDKFEHIHFGPCDNPQQYLDPNGSEIMRQNEIKDLGVIISNDLSWSNHIDATIAKCRRMSAWILRTFTKRDVITMRTLWVSMLRPLIDYCSPVWSPHPTSFGQIDRLEGVLRSFSKHVEGLEHLNYAARLKELRLHSIQRRHERYKIIYLYKIKEKLVPQIITDPMHPENSPALEFRDSKYQRHGVRCHLKIPKLYGRKAAVARRSSFTETAAELWNCLPACITTLTNLTVDAFKQRLDKLLDIYPDEPRCNASGLYLDHVFRKTNSIKHMSENSGIKSRVDQFEKHQQQLIKHTSGGPHRGNPPSR